MDQKIGVCVENCMFGMFFFRSSPNRFINFILTRSVLIGHINIGLIMIENKHTKHASKYGLGSRRCSKISKVIILVIIFI